MTQQIHVEDHQGLRVQWTLLPGPLRASLTFGVGHRDEPPHLGGITHLAEHLVLRLAGPTRPWENGVTGPGTMSFLSIGSPSEVKRFLHRVAEVLNDPRPSSRDVDLERRIIEAEMPDALAPSAGLTTFRYGLGGVGNTHAGVPALPSITAEEVEGWVRTWCTAQNAVLSLSGPPPEGLDLTLPVTTDAPPVPDNPSGRLSGPSLISCSKTGVALSLVAPAASALWIRDALTEVLTRALRDRQGLIYSVDPEVTAVTCETAQIDFVLDPAGDDTEQTARLAVEAVREAALSGIDETVVTVVRGAAELWLNEPDAWFDYLESSAAAHLRGGNEHDPDALLEKASGLTVGSLRTMVGDALPTLMVAVDVEEVEDDVQLASSLELEHCADLIGGGSAARRRGAGRTWRGRLGSGGSWFRLDGSVALLHNGDLTRQLDLGDVVIAGRFADGDLALVDDCGHDVVIEPGFFRRGTGLVSAILEHVDPVVVRDFSWYDDRPERADE